MQDDEAIREFNRQRDHLEKQLGSVRSQLQKALSGSKGDINKIMDVSSVANNLKNMSGTCISLFKTCSWILEEKHHNETYMSEIDKTIRRQHVKSPTRVNSLLRGPPLSNIGT